MLSNISHGSHNINNNFSSNISKAHSAASKINNLSKNQAYYAKKGEPIYQKDMDLDEDGIVTFDEFQQYCKESGADPEKLLKNWLVYHASKDAEETSKQIKETKEKNNKNEQDDIVYAKKGDGKYESVMDSNDDGKITYKEYLEYCKSNAKKEEKPSNKTQQALNEYTKEEPPEGKIETVA